MIESRLASRILDVRAGTPPSRAVLAAITGIDGSGKGWMSARAAAALEARGLRVAVLNVDGWLTLPPDPCSEGDPAERFYSNGVHFEEMFERLVLPLRNARSIRAEWDSCEETPTACRPPWSEHHDVDVILLEGIFLLKPAFRAHYDFSCWIDCTYETALERAVARAQEGLSPEDTVRAYRTIYFPAQEIHRRRDRPRAAASMIVVNDPRLAC